MIIHLDQLEWEPTSLHMASYESIRRYAWLSIKFYHRNETVDDTWVDEWMSHSLRLCLHRGSHYYWPASMWNTFVSLMEERREAVWTETHVWPAALAFYHLLTRRGVDMHCARHYVKTLYLVPGRAAFAKVPTKHRGKTKTKTLVEGHATWLVRVRP